MRSFSTAGYSFFPTSPIRGPACTDGEGAYVDHKGVPKPFAWPTRHRDRRDGDDVASRKVLPGEELQVGNTCCREAWAGMLLELH